MIKSIAFDVTMQLIENRILQNKDSNIEVVEASNVAQHNTVLATPANAVKKRRAKPIKCHQNPTILETELGSEMAVNGGRPL